MAFVLRGVGERGGSALTLFTGRGSSRSQLSSGITVSSSVGVLEVEFLAVLHAIEDLAASHGPSGSSSSQDGKGALGAFVHSASFHFRLGGLIQHIQSSQGRSSLGRGKRGSDLGVAALVSAEALHEILLDVRQKARVAVRRSAVRAGTVHAGATERTAAVTGHTTGIAFFLAVVAAAVAVAHHESLQEGGNRQRVQTVVAARGQR